MRRGRGGGGGGQVSTRSSAFRLQCSTAAVTEAAALHCTAWDINEVHRMKPACDGSLRTKAREALLTALNQKKGIRNKSALHQQFMANF